MEDRELLELAAKAAGICNDGEGPRVDDETGFFLREWNPLTDDSDALRLAVKLNIHVMQFENMTTARPLFANFGCDERYDGNAYGATRRAIVRAAAEIWKSMNGQDKLEVV